VQPISEPSTKQTYLTGIHSIHSWVVNVPRCLYTSVALAHRGIQGSIDKLIDTAAKNTGLMKVLSYFVLVLRFYFTFEAPETYVSRCILHVALHVALQASTPLLCVRTEWRVESLNQLLDSS
jgi:hypothetical protein